jgi:YD repeat-containing protein
MKEIAFIQMIFLLAYLGSAQAETRTYFDSNGDIVGTEMPAGPKSRFYYGSDGGLAGSSMDAGNTRYYYDADGNLAGPSMSSGRRRNN